LTFKVKDHYYKKAKDNNFYARSVFKLEEIDKKFSVFQKNDRVLDLGYFPGSWIQYTLTRIGENGIICGIDIQEINNKLLHHKNIILLKKSVDEINSIQDLGYERTFDVVLSDMAPSTTGIKSVDQIRSMDLVEKVFSLLPYLLKPQGKMVVKVFDSNDAQVFLKEQKRLFNKLHYFRPKSTRTVSKEFFVIGDGFMHNR